MSAAVEVGLDATQARVLTDRIKVGVEAVWELITQAYTQRAWSALGYQSWDDYCTREFGTTRLRLPREERAEVVASLRESGLSIRAIAAATGLNKETVNNVTRELSGNRTSVEPEPVGEDAVADELIVAEQELPPLPENYMNVPGAVTGSTPGQTDRVAESIAKAKKAAAAVDRPPPQPAVTGLDGKRYPATKPLPDAVPSKPPKRRPITDAFDSANYELRRAVERVVRLAEDDRLQKNKDQIVGANLSDLIRARDALTDVIQQLEG